MEPVGGQKQDLITQIKWIYVLQIVSDYKLFPLHPYILFMPDASLFLRHLEIHPVINPSPAPSIYSVWLDTGPWLTVYKSKRNLYKRIKDSFPGFSAVICLYKPQDLRDLWIRITQRTALHFILIAIDTDILPSL